MFSCRFTDELDPTHFHCIRYIGSPLKSNFDKTVLYYKFEDFDGGMAMIMPLAFTWTEEGNESHLILPLWMRKMGDFDELKFEKVVESIEFSGTLSLEWLANLQPNYLDRFPFDEILPQIFGGKRPLCNGTVLPFIFKGQRYLMKVKAEGVEDGKIFWFNLEIGTFNMKWLNPKKPNSKELEVLKNGSWMDEIKVLKYQLNGEFEIEDNKLLYLICGVPLPLQREFIELLDIEYDPVEIFIPEEHYGDVGDDGDDSGSGGYGICSVNSSGNSDGNSGTNDQLFITQVLGEVEIISPNLMTEIFKKISKRAIFLTSANSIESSSNLLQLEKLANRFNFQVLNFNLPIESKKEKNNIFNGTGNIFKEMRNFNELKFPLNRLKGSETDSNILPPNSTNPFPFYGYEMSRKNIENLIIGPLINSEAYDRFKLPKSSGFLIHGPTGCGKTLLCLNILTKSEFNQFFTIFHIPTASQLLSKYFGETEANIRKLFAQARERRPSIIFIDQIETLGRKRGLSSGGGDGGSNERYLSTLLNEMDGISGNDGVTILACANDIEILDEALLRPGRLDRHFYLGLPDETDRREIINAFMKNNLNIKHLIKETAGLSGAEIKYAIKNLK